MDESLRESALEYHRQPRPGKIAIEPTKALVNPRDLALAPEPLIFALANPEPEIRPDIAKAARPDAADRRLRRVSRCRCFPTRMRRDRAGGVALRAGLARRTA